MYWVLQNNLFHEKGMQELKETLERFNIPHSEHKVIPFIGELEPDINPEGNVMIMGSYSVRHSAKKKAWVPGIFEVPGYDVVVKAWGKQVLNHDAVYCSFYDSILNCNHEDFFIRPVEDAKYFAGIIMDWRELHNWWEKVVVLEEDDGTSLRKDTRVMIASLKKIYKEFRFWIIDKKVITASLYKRGGKVLYENIDQENIEKDVKWFVGGLLNNLGVPTWNPSRAYVLDVCLTEEGEYKVIEINNINLAGLYAANVPKLVMAFEGMKF